MSVLTEIAENHERLARNIEESRRIRQEIARHRVSAKRCNTEIFAELRRGIRQSPFTRARMLKLIEALEKQYG